MTTLLTLVRKDWRLFRVPVVASAVLGVASYAVAYGSYLIDQRDEGYLPNYWPRWQDDITGAAVFGIIVMGVMAAVFGAAAFAGERRERWADFLHTLPPSRPTVVLSKLVVAAAAIVTFALVHVGVILLVARTPYNQLEWHFIAVWSSGTMMAFGVAWLLSTFLNSAAMSASVPLALGVGLAMFIQLMRDARNWNGDWPVIVWSVFAGVIGLVSLVAGTVYYLRRVEP